MNIIRIMMIFLLIIITIGFIEWLIANIQADHDDRFWRLHPISEKFITKYNLLIKQETEFYNENIIYLREKIDRYTQQLKYYPKDSDTYNKINNVIEDFKKQYINNVEINKKMNEDIELYIKSEKEEVIRELQDNPKVISQLYYVLNYKAKRDDLFF